MQTDPLAGSGVIFISEKWLPVVGFDGRYEVSNLGRVRTFVAQNNTDDKRGILRLQKNNRGYLRVRLYDCKMNKRPWRRVHRMVAESFIGLAPDKDYTVDHLDFDKLNNCFLNLQWLTRMENYRRWREREIANDPDSAPF